NCYIFCVNLLLSPVELELRETWKGTQLHRTSSLSARNLLSWCCKKRSCGGRNCWTESRLSTRFLKRASTGWWVTRLPLPRKNSYPATALEKLASSAEGKCFPVQRIWAQNRTPASLKVPANLPLTRLHKVGSGCIWPPTSATAPDGRSA